MHVISLLTLGVFTAAAAAVDYRTGHIPNSLAFALAGLGAVLGVGGAVEHARDTGQSIASALGMVGAAAALGVALCTAVPFVLYRARAMGGGDVKLLGAVGATAGPMLGLEIELTAFVVAALFVGCRLAYRGQLLRLLANTLSVATNLFGPRGRRRKVPEELLTSLRFAPAVFAATLLSIVAHWRAP